MKLAIKIESLCKDYVLGAETVRALRNVSFDVPVGDYISIMGPSGSGKSTLLNLLGCLDQPSNGRFFLGDADISSMNDDELSEIRSTKIGFIFQSYNLLPSLSVVENIEVPLQYQGRHSAADREWCIELAKRVGLGNRLNHRPTELSGGQQQRVAVARSLVNDPKFILADEPTGNLDTATTNEILDLLQALNEEGRTILLVTHEDEVAERTKRSIILRDGKIQSDEVR